MLDKSLKIIELVLVAAVVFLGVEIFYEIVEYRLDTASMTALRVKEDDTEAAANSRKPQRLARFGDYKVIAERNLFNLMKKEKSQDEIRASNREELEKTKLKLRLWGTIAGTGGSSYAVIENESDSEQKLYRTGDTIEGARIKMILRKKVVLDVNGNDEILEMEDQQSSTGSAARDARSGMPDVSDSGGSDVSDSGGSIVDLMRQARVRPYFEDGKPSGILLSGIRSGSIFEEMGLESGDIVKAVNGKEIRSMDDAMEFYENFKSAGEIDLDIQRNGSQRSIQYRID